MALIAGLSLGFFFIFMAHSLLVYFLVEDNLRKNIPLKDAFFPWPSKGKMVACVCLVAACFFGLIAKRGVSAFMGIGSDEWKVIGIFIGIPASWYLIYFFRRINKSGSTYLFKATQSTPLETLFPLVVSLSITLFSYLTK
ncbi:hypothetical protein [Denitratisoma sp. agr-D3]